MWATPKVGIRTPSEYENPFWNSDVFRMTDLDDWIMANIEDKNEIIIGDIVFDEIDEISWPSTLFIVNPRQTGLIQVNASSATIGDGQFAYLLVPRPYQNATLTMQIGSPPFTDEAVVPIGYRKGTKFYIKGRGDSSAGGGDFSGPAGAKDSAIVAFDGTSGKLSKDTPSEVMEETNYHGVRFSDPNAPSNFYYCIGVNYVEPNGAGGSIVLVGDLLMPLEFQCSATDPIINKFGSAVSKIIHEEVASGWNIKSSGKISQPGADTAFVLERESEGTNGEVSALFVGDRDPNGNVTGDPGDEYIRVDGANSTRYLHTGTGSSNNDWTAYSAGATGDFSGPVSSDQYAMVIFANAGGKTGMNSVAKVIDLTDYHALQVSKPDAPTTWLGVAGIGVYSNGLSGAHTILGNEGISTIIFSQNNRYYTDASGSKEFIQEDMQKSWHVPQPGKISQGTDDGTVVFSLQNTGTNSGLARFLVGSQDPEGNVTAPPMTVYFREDGSNSRLYVKQSGTGSTGWITGSGDFVGPAGATADALVAFNGATGKIGKDTPTKIIDTAARHGLQISSPNAPSSFYDMVGVFYEAPNGAGGTWIDIGDASLQFHMYSLTDPVISVAAGPLLKIIHEGISSGWNIANSGKISQPGADTAFVLERESEGTNGALSALFVGDRDPNGNVTGDPGDEYIRVDGASSMRYLHTGTGSSNNDWTAYGITGTVQAEDVGIKVISTPTYDDVQDTINQFGLAGTDGDSYISDAGGGQIDVAAGSGFIRVSDSHTAELRAFDWSALNGQAIPSDSIRYVGVKYNAGSPVVEIRSVDTWDVKDEFRLGTVVNEGGTLHILNNPQRASNSAGMTFERFFETRPLERANRLGGLEPGETGTRNVTLSQGELYDGFNEFLITAIDTSGSDTFDAYYRDGGGGWTKQSAQTQWNNTQYDDGDGTLGALGTNNYGIHWVYLEADGSLVLLYGQGDYNNQAAAENASPPAAVPLRISAHGLLIGRFIFQKSASTLASIASVWDTVFNFTATGGTGDFVGPAGATADALVAFADTTGKLGKDTPTKIIDTVSRHGLQMSSPNAPSSFYDMVGVFYLEPNGAGGTWIDIGDASLQFHMYSLTDPVISVAAGPLLKIIHEGISSGWNIASSGKFSQPGADTAFVLERESEGTNGEVSALFVGDRDPNGNVTGDPGDEYIRIDGANSMRYLHTGTGSSNNDWTAYGFGVQNVGFYGYRTTGTQTLLTTTETKVEFPNKQDDPGGDFDATTTYVFTAPTTGTYSFAANAQVTTTDKGRIDLRLYHNTTMVAEGGAKTEKADTLRPHVSIARRQMTANDTMEVRAYSTAALSAIIQNTGLTFNGAQLRAD